MERAEKHKTRTSDAHKKKEEDFKEKTNYLFDIAHIDVMKMIKNPKTRPFS